MAALNSVVKIYNNTLIATQTSGKELTQKIKLVERNQTKIKLYYII